MTSRTREFSEVTSTAEDLKLKDKTKPSLRTWGQTLNDVETMTVSEYRISSAISAVNAMRAATCQTCCVCGSSAFAIPDWGSGCARDCTLLSCQTGLIFDWTEPDPADKCKP